MFYLEPPIELPKMSEPTESPQLKRTLGFPLLTFYGVGTIVGAGFYALTGEVAGHAGMLCPMAFGVSALIALLSALSFAELSARYPYSAGEARYVAEAFRQRWLSTLVGWLVILTGVVSAAAMANAFAGFVFELCKFPHWLSIVLLVLSLGLVASWGIGESAVLATLITLIELGGLLFVFAYASPALSTLPDRWTEMVPGWDATAWSGILVGAYLAFYSFVGFEDMVNVAEEVKQPQRTLPWAILTAVGVTGVIYVLVSLVVVLRVAPDVLAESESPFSVVFGNWPAAARAMTSIGMLAGINGTLIQIVMASRVAYGLGAVGQGPSCLAYVHPVRRTPWVATALASATVLTLALGFPIVRLAEATATILLVVFAMVNASLLVIKWRSGKGPEDCPDYPIVVPFVGAVACLGFVLFKLISTID